MVLLTICNMSNVKIETVSTILWNSKLCFYGKSLQCKNLDFWLYELFSAEKYTSSIFVWLQVSRKINYINNNNTTIYSIYIICIILEIYTAVYNINRWFWKPFLNYSLLVFFFCNIDNRWKLTTILFMNFPKEI